MEQGKSQPITTPMRDRLTANKQGRLLGTQWKDLVVEPLVPLLFLLIPAILIVGRFPFALRGLVYAFIIASVIAGGTLIFRGIRYARLPVCYAQLYVEQMPARWRLWQAVTLSTVHGKQLSFPKKLTALPSLEPGSAYVVYFLEDHNTRILLSIAPADHPETHKWLPTEAFDARGGQRVDDSR